MPCLTQALMIQRASFLSPTFSAARIFPCVRWSRNSRNVFRASGSCSTSPREARRSMEDFREDMRGKYKGKAEVKSQNAEVKAESYFCILTSSFCLLPSDFCIYTHLHSLRISTPVIA